MEGVDRCEKLILDLRSDVTASLQEVANSGRLSVSEVGVPQPYAFTKHFGDGSHMILFASGLMNFLLAVAQTLHGATRTFIGKANVIEPALPVAAMSTHLARL
jgi:hypothetical protein